MINNILQLAMKHFHIYSNLDLKVTLNLKAYCWLSWIMLLFSGIIC